MNFPAPGSDGRRYIGTASHCVLGSEGKERTWRPGRGPLAWDGSGRTIGKFAYAVFGGEKDFALIRLRKDVKSWARMCHFGGATGINRSRGSQLVRLQYYGNGLLVRSAAAGRSAWATGMPDPHHVYANGVAVWGDSGSAVTSADGRAVGVLVTGGVHVGGVRSTAVDPGTIGIARLGPQLWRAKKGHGRRPETPNLERLIGGLRAGRVLRRLPLPSPYSQSKTSSLVSSHFPFSPVSKSSTDHWDEGEC